MTAAARAPIGRAPDFSLVVPCYNEARHLRASVRSVVEVLEQTGWTWDIVFVDDRSEDDTARSFATSARPTRAAAPCSTTATAAAAPRSRPGSPPARGRVTGFLDIDLEVHARYIPGLVAEIERHGADVATGRRHYLLRQTGGLHRAALSWGYRRLSNFLLSLDLEDSETGCKFFSRETAAADGARQRRTTAGSGTRR